MQLALNSASIRLASTLEGQLLFGPNDHYLHLMEDAFRVRFLLRDDEVLVQGMKGDLEQVTHLIEVLLELIRSKKEMTKHDVTYAISLAKEGRAEELLSLYEAEVARTQKGKIIRAKTLGQSHYITSLRKKEIVFAVGPAGTGKTYLAVVVAVQALRNGLVKRIVLTRPAVEAGERLGFLPGDLQEKVDPYLRPLYDALYDMMGVEQVNRSLEKGLIEVAPLAYMRGRTLEESYIILDEAQNTTPEQMKMFLTRLGVGSRMVITGDITQIDLPKSTKSGLQDAWERLQSIPDIGFIRLRDQDVVRHRLVRQIVEAYDQQE